MSTWDSPNQQVVRGDASHPSEEGSGGSSAKPAAKKGAKAAPAPAPAEAKSEEAGG